MGWVVRDALVRASLIIGGVFAVTAPVTGVVYMNNKPIEITTEEKEYVLGQ